MNIVILIRNVSDCRVPLPPDKFGERPLPEGMISIINPADWAALELALDFNTRDNGKHNIMVIAIGGQEAEDSLRWCLAAGARQALRIWDEALDGADLLGKGKAIAASLLEIKPDIVMCGDGCLDQLNTALPGFAAAAAGMPYVPGVTKVEKTSDGQAVVIRRLEKGKRERVAVRLPALVALESSGMPEYYAGLSATIDAFTAMIPCEDLVSLGLSRERAGLRGAKVHEIEVRVARPMIVKPLTPDPNLPAEQRLRTILAGSVVRKQGETITGTPEQLADRIVDFLRRQQVVSS